MTRLDACVVPVSAAGLVGPERGEVAGGRVTYPLLSAEAMEGLCARLRAGREALLAREVRDIAASLGAVGARFAREGDPLRQEALALVPDLAGLSPEMARVVVDGMVRDWTEERLVELLEAEFDDPTVLDGFRPGPRGHVRALGPPLTVHVGAGTVPGVSVTSLIRALLVKSAALVKPGLGGVVLPTLFLRALSEADPELAGAAAVLYWPGGAAGGSREAEDAALGAADLVVVYGGDETVTSVRSRLPAATRLLAYHHRVSLGLVGADALADENAARGTARAAALAVATFDQRGCVSPHVIYVQRGAAVDPPAWATFLAQALDALETDLPGGAPSPEEASAMHQTRGAAELRAAAGDGVTVYSGEAASWTVILEPEPDFRPSCLNRTVRIKPIGNLEDVIELLGGLERHLQTIAVAGAGEAEAALTEALARAGALRITDFESAPWPPPWWHHDGLGPLNALVRWVDVEP